MQTGQKRKAQCFSEIGNDRNPVQTREFLAFVTGECQPGDPTGGAGGVATAFLEWPAGRQKNKNAWS